MKFSIYGWLKIHGGRLDHGGTVFYRHLDLRLSFMGIFIWTDVRLDTRDHRRSDTWIFVAACGARHNWNHHFDLKALI